MDVRKAEERSLSDQIHQNLQMLLVMYPSNFQNCLARDMFIKPNTKAFPFVMHFLFNIHDSAELKKRFYWPLLDRNSENNFRTGTVQYLNYLNEKHNLGWGEVKSFLVVMPGGMKFMKLLMDLINFVVQEEIKKVEKALPDSIDTSKSLRTEQDLKHVIEQHQIFISNAVQYKEELNSKTKLLKENTEKLKETLEDVCKAIDIDPNEIDQQFGQSFAESNRRLFESSIVKEVNGIQVSEVLIEKLSNDIDEFYNEKHQLTCDKEALVASYETIQNDFPGDCPNSIRSVGDKISLKSLFDAFNCIVPAITSAIAQLELKGKDCYEFEENAIEKIMDEANELECDICKIEKIIDEIEVDVNDTDSPKSLGTPNRLSAYAESNLKLKYVKTPAIYVDPEAQCSTTCLRLPLLEENAVLSTSFAHQTTVLAPKSARDKNIPFVMPAFTKSKLMDPLTLMRSVTKSKRKHVHKQNESFPSNNPDEHLSHTIIGAYSNNRSSSTVKKNDPFVEKSKYSIDTQAIRSPDSINYQQKNRTKSVHDAIQALDINTMSKSPSGRLDPLVQFDQQELPDIFLNKTPSKSGRREDLPRILLNDDTLMNLEKTTSVIEEDLKSSELDKENCPGNQSGRDDLQKATDVGLQLQRQKLFSIEIEESIFNVSDSILNDITM